jgi:peptidoglycan/xylan/chitin deacetylase (PgdA/CDA1 family)
MAERSRSDVVSDVEVPILMYHEVSPSPHPAFRRYTVTVRDFTRQMRWLAAFGYQPIDMDTLVRARQGHASLPRRPVVITFDDGFQGCADYAVPVLRTHGFTAMFYLVAGLMGTTSRWLRPELGMELALMSWDTARSLAAEGFRCGAHSLTHPRLAGLDAASLRPELVDARRRMEDELAQPVLHFAYPYGAFDQTVQTAAAEAGYITACSTRPGRSGVGDDLLALHRVSVYGHDSLLDFAFRLRTGAALRERLGQAFGGAAQRRASPGGTGS